MFNVVETIEAQSRGQFWTLRNENEIILKVIKL